MQMNRIIAKAGLLGAAVLLVANAASPVPPVWREAFQSSPATYEAPSEEFIKIAAAQTKYPIESIRAGLLPQPVSGTIRYRIAVQVAGSQIRIRLSNEEGKAPLRLDAASVGIAADGFSARAGTLQPLTFGRATSVTIPAGAPVLSDPVMLAVRAGTELVVSAALGSPFANEMRGGSGFVVAPGHQALRPTLDQSKPMNGRPLVSGVSVLSTPPRRIIVAFGDSITDGYRAAVGAPHSWPEQFARRLAARKTGGTYTVLNAGIGGNRLLSGGWGASALARLDRDALRIGGVSHVILLEGINDIGMAGKSAFATNPEVTADEIISAYRQVIARAHTAGIKVYIGTLPPNNGSVSHSSPEKDAMREAVNRWIRTSREADAVIDFEAMTRDPKSPARFLPAFDSGDHLHPSDAGYKAMGDGIDLRLFP